MAFSSLFTLLDDIASVLDDVSLMTKVAAKKTAGVVGDDLALNANQITGVRAERELPIVWAVAKGSLLNKAILVPLALLLSVYAPYLVLPLLMAGGAYLCFEGAEKLLHRLFHRHDETPDTVPDHIAGDEKSKIRGAIRTDFILSAEIVIIALGSLQEASTTVKILALCAVGIAITAGVYGLVAAVVKADDFGAALLRRGGRLLPLLGRAILLLMPWFMRLLGVAGTLAMFTVGGGIFVHNIPALHHLLQALGLDGGAAGMLGDLLAGLAIGSAVCALVLPAANLLRRRKAA